MGKVASADTVYAVAYLTDKGRTYLFNKNNVRFDSSGNDLFQVQSFTLSDTDTNYNTSARLESGDVPDVTGKSTGCLKTSADLSQTIFTYYTVDAAALVSAVYVTDATNNVLSIQTDTAFPINSSTDNP